MTGKYKQIKDKLKSFINIIYNTEMIINIITKYAAWSQV